MKTLFLQAPSYDGFDGGAGPRYQRYQAKREIRPFWCRDLMKRRLREGAALFRFPRAHEA